MAANPILYDSHIHTILCHHATGELEQYAEAAETANLKGIIFTEHLPIPDWGAQDRLDINDLCRYFDLVRGVKEQFKGRIDVLLGLESDFMPGLESWISEIHSRADFDFFLGSIHPHVQAFKDRYWKDDEIAFQLSYFDVLAQAAESGLFDCLGHADIIKLQCPENWDPEKIFGCILESLDRIAATGIAVELNTGGALKSIPEMNPGLAILRAMRERFIPVVLGSDAHEPERVGGGFLKALHLLEQAGYNTIRYYKKRRAIEIDIETAISSLR